MTGLFPFRYEVDEQRDGHALIDIFGEDASVVFLGLASETVREILIRLDDAPGTASDVAESVDTTLQNVLYHLDSLQEAGLVQVVDTWYSCRGVEMKVYAPAFESVVLVAGDERTVDVVERVARDAPAD